MNSATSSGLSGLNISPQYLCDQRGQASLLPGRAFFKGLLQVRVNTKGDWGNLGHVCGCRRSRLRKQVGSMYDVLIHAYGAPNMVNRYTYSAPFTSEQLHHDYVVCGMTQTEVGAKWGVSQKVVWRALRKAGITASTAATPRDGTLRQLIRSSTDDETFKTCSRCGERKNRAAFIKRRRALDGYCGQCRACHNARSTAWWAAHPERKSAAHRRWRARNRAYTLHHNSEVRARRLKVAFSLSVEWIAERIKRGHCEATGIPFDVSPSKWIRKTMPLRPSLDRIDSTLGYTPDNVRVVCLIYNLCKNTFSHEDVIAFATAVSVKSTGEAHAHTSG